MTDEPKGPRIYNFDTGEEIPEGMQRAQMVAIVIPETTLAILEQARFIEKLGDDHIYVFHIIPFLDSMIRSIMQEVVTLLVGILFKVSIAVMLTLVIWSAWKFFS